MTEKTIAQMSSEVRKLNTDMGWRDQGKTVADYIALLHTEAAEMTEAWRLWGLADKTEPLDVRVLPGGELDSLEPGLDYPLPKPEGVGSELADVLIRTLDTADVIGVRPFATGKVGKLPAGTRDATEWNRTMSEVVPWEMAEVLRRGRIPSPLVSFGDHVSWLHREIDKAWSEPDEIEALLKTIVYIADRYGFDLMFEYERKMRFNRTREFRHGGKRL